MNFRRIPAAGDTERARRDQGVKIVAATESRPGNGISGRDAALSEWRGKCFTRALGSALFFCGGPIAQSVRASDS